jgi:hypothetical protein
MTNRTVETSPQTLARIAGVLYLIIIVGGIFAEIFVRQQLVVKGDPAATATNILAHEMLYRLGFASGVIMLMCALPLLFILYHLLNRVNKSFAINSFVNFLAPQYSLFPYIGIPPFIAELSHCLWLMVKGVNVPKWEETASAWRGAGAKLF